MCKAITAALFGMHFLIITSAFGVEQKKREFEEKPAPVIETGLQFMSGVNPIPAADVEFQAYWLSNHLIIVNAAQESPEANVRRMERTMLVEAGTGKSRQLIDAGWILACFNPKRNVGAIRPSPFTPTLPFKRRDQDDWQYRWVHIDTDGTVTRISDVSELSTGCLPRYGFPKGASYAPLREEHGYILNMP
jgi:hypothetical protein